MFEHFVRHLPARLPERGATPSPWSYLERHPRVRSDDLEQLQRWYADACAGRRVPLARLHNLIARIDRQIA